MNILNPKFKYTPAARTNLWKTFARVRAAIKKDEDERLQKIIRMPVKEARK